MTPARRWEYSEHFHVYDELRDLLRSRRLQPGSRFDPAAHLSHRYHPDAIIRAVQMLRDEGLLDPAEEEPQVAEQRTRSRRGVGFFADYEKQGRQPTVATLELGLIDRADVPAEAGFDESDDVFVRHLSLQSVDGVPHAVCESFVPFLLVRDSYRRLRDGGVDLYVLLEAAEAAPERISEALRVDFPTAQEREWLDLLATPSLPVVRLAGHAYAADRLVEYYLLCDRSDLYEFAYSFSVGPPK